MTRGSTQAVITAGVHPHDTGTILAAILAASHRPLTGILQDLSGCQLILCVQDAGERPLTTAEAFRLDADAATRARCRRGLLVTTDGIPAALTSLLWLPGRLPRRARLELDQGTEPAGVILGRYGVRREDRRAMAVRGSEEEAVRSSAVLVVAGVKVAIAGEAVTREFAEQLAAVAP